MPETHETPRNVLIAALFCTIIGIIVYAGLDSGMAGQKAKGLVLGPKIPANPDEAGEFLP